VNDVYVIHSIGTDAHTYEDEFSSQTVTVVAQTIYSIAENSKNSLPEEYPYFWDLMAEHSESECSFVELLNPTGTIDLRPFYYSVDTVTIEPTMIYQFEIDNIGGDAIHNVNCSLYENKGEDIDKFEFVKSKKSQNTFNLPIVFNNMGAAVKYNTYPHSTDDDPDDMSYVGVLKIPRNPACLRTLVVGENEYNFRHPKNVTEEHLFDLFYLDSSDVYWEDVAEMPMKVHEFVSVAFGDGSSSADKTDTALDEFDITSPYNYLVEGRPTEMYSAMQIETFKPAILPKIVAYAFGNPKFARIKIEVPLNAVTNFQAGGSFGFVWWNNIYLYKFSFDLSNYHSRLATLGTDWYAVKVEVDLDRETATVELINKVI
jgi:hypothetical protein